MPLFQQHPDLMARLVAAQNARTDIDIVTFAAFCDSRDELEAHVVRYEDRLAVEAEMARAA